ncbi:MAG: 30S ribosomal protein S9 [Patescibacteria group bacterium]|jgi:small subunit ribosomal protein S9
MAERKTSYVAAVGRRKRAVARVRLTTGTGKVTINGKEIAAEQPVVRQPLTLAGVADKVDVSAKVLGGGVNGQLEAVRHGIARALVAYQADFKSALKKAGLLTRDPREKERKKPGLKRARRAPQWAKR